MKYRVLVVDDEELNLRATTMQLETWGYAVDKAENGDKAIKFIKDKRHEYAVILMDFRMPEKNGAQTAAEIRKYNKESVILMYSADDSRVATRDSFKLGDAFDFIDKGPNVETLKNAMIDACKEYEVFKRILRQDAPNSEIERYLESIGLVGVSGAMIEVGRKIMLYRVKDRTTLLIGESGTGKEIIAKALHTRSGKFFAINCASFSKGELLESELCGYEKGAFTGANQRKIGILELANGGTVFFDELHRLDLNAQAKLLRIMQEKKIKRVGGAEEMKVDFKIICGTQPGIEEMVQRGEFLLDLFHRVNYLIIRIPPLRDRPEDIGPLVSHFKDKYNVENNTKREFLKSTVRAMEKFSWPGNVREVDTETYKLLTDAKMDKIGPDQLDQKKFGSVKLRAVTPFEDFQEKQDWDLRCWIVALLTNADSVTHAAELAGMAVSTLRSIMNKLGIDYKNWEKSKRPAF